MIDSLRSVGTLRPGLTPQRAIDVLWLLNSPAVFAHLVRRAGWSLDQYQAWLADAMVNEILDHDQPHGSRQPPPEASDPTLWLTVKTHASTPRTEQTARRCVTRTARCVGRRPNAGAAGAGRGPISAPNALSALSE